MPLYRDDGEMETTGPVPDSGLAACSASLSSGSRTGTVRLLLGFLFSSRRTGLWSSS